MQRTVHDEGERCPGSGLRVAADSPRPSAAAIRCVWRVQRRSPVHRDQVDDAHDAPTNDAQNALSVGGASSRTRSTVLRRMTPASSHDGFLRGPPLGDAATRPATDLGASIPARRCRQPASRPSAAGDLRRVTLPRTGPPAGCRRRHRPKRGLCGVPDGRLQAQPSAPPIAAPGVA